jgi:hypothetical protein
MSQIEEKMKLTAIFLFSFQCASRHAQKASMSTEPVLTTMIERVPVSANKIIF